MTTLWVTILAVAVANAVIKAAGITPDVTQ